MKKLYQNYHCHKFGSNIYTADSPSSLEDYAKRAKELGHGILSSLEHGFQGLYFQAFEMAKKYGLHFIYGVEAYWVKDRFEKDKTNGHICLFAKTDKGRRAINLALAEANETGYYYKPRLDLELLMKLPAEDVFLTSACVGFWQYQDIEDIVIQLHEKFKENFMLEVQYHTPLIQIELNKRILELSKKHDIQIIAGMDSHYIYPEQKIDRSEVLKSKGIVYENEDDWYMDYADGETVIQRFKAQGVLSDEEIHQALDNTNIFLTFEDFNYLDIFSDRIKLPTLYPDLTQQERDDKLKGIIQSEWNKVKHTIPKEKHNLYRNEIRKETQIITDTAMTDYFLIDYEIVKDAVKNGGMITPSGRGSAVSFYTNTLLGFSKIDRISASVKMFPERFLSKSRILESKTLADIDLNSGNPEVFAESQRRIFGEHNSYPMIAYGTFKKKSAFKMYAKSQDIDFELANLISSQIEKYEQALKHASDDDAEEVNVYDFIDKEFHEIYDKSTIYQGIIASKATHPCAWLIYDKDIREEIGVIKVKSDSTKKETMVCLMDGLAAEKFKYLKNDLLKVDVVKFFYQIAKKVGEEIPTESELIKLCENNSKVWDIYASGFTLGVNQVEKDNTKQKAMRYQPRNIAEVCAFVAGIRPSFQSMYNIFESRKKFEYGIKTFDKIIQDTGLESSFMLYQETVMAVLSFAGFPDDKTYDIIKAISKKRLDKINSIKEEFHKNFKEKIRENDGLNEQEASEASEKVWMIIENSSQYGFNASHSYSYAYDSLLGAYYKATYPLYFYETLLQEYSEKGNKDKVMALKAEMTTAFGLTLEDIKFGNDNRMFVADIKNNTMRQSMLSMKRMSQSVANELYKLGKVKYNSFYDLLIAMSDAKVKSDQMEILININYFKDYAGEKKIKKYVELFNALNGAKQFSKTGEYAVSVDFLKDYCVEKPKTYAEFDSERALKDLWNKISDKEFGYQQKVQHELEYLGYAQTLVPELPDSYAIVTIIEQSFSNKFITLHRLAKGGTEKIKVRGKAFDNNEFVVGDIIVTNEIAEEKRKRKIDGQWVNIDEVELILKKWEVIRK